jgi:hypothetical protein
MFTIVSPLRGTFKHFRAEMIEVKDIEGTIAVHRELIGSEVLTPVVMKTTFSGI